MRAIWILPDGSRQGAEVAAGVSLMEAAVAHGIERIEGACGGCLSCATCHVVVAPEWVGKLDPMGDFEDAMLDSTEVARRETSRLSCQITMRDTLDGITLIVPAD